MAELKGTLVASKLVPTDSNDTFAVTDEKYNRGGYRTVDTYAERDEVTAERRKRGMLVHVIESGNIYMLRGGIENSHWVDINEVLSITPSHRAYVADDTIHSSRVVAINENAKVVPAQPINALSVIGISINSASVDEPVKVAVNGEIRDLSFTFIPGNPIFFTDDGVITQSVPAIASYIIGIANSTNSFIFDKQIPIFTL